MTVARLADQGRHAGGRWPVLAGLVAAVLVCMALGCGIERIAYRPLRNAPRLAPLITAIGVSIVLQNLAMIDLGPQLPCLPAAAAERSISSSLGATLHGDPGRSSSSSPALTMAGLILLVNRTRLGRAMRATAENPPGGRA